MRERHLIESADGAVLSVVEVSWFRRRHQRPGGSTVNAKVSGAPESGRASTSEADRR